MPIYTDRMHEREMNMSDKAQKGTIASIEDGIKRAEQGHAAGSSFDDNAAEDGFLQKHMHKIGQSLVKSMEGHSAQSVHSSVRENFKGGGFGFAGVHEPDIAALLKTPADATSSAGADGKTADGTAGDGSGSDGGEEWFDEVAKAAVIRRTQANLGSLQGDVDKSLRET